MEPYESVDAEILRRTVHDLQTSDIGHYVERALDRARHEVFNELYQENQFLKGRLAALELDQIKRNLGVPYPIDRPGVAKVKDALQILSGCVLSDTEEKLLSEAHQILNRWRDQIDAPTPDRPQPPAGGAADEGAPAPGRYVWGPPLQPRTAWADARPDGEDGPDEEPGASAVPGSEGAQAPGDGTP